MKTEPQSTLKTLKISYETFRKAAKYLDQHQLLQRRFGKKVANKLRAPRMAGVTTTRPLERVEIDHFLADVYLVDPETGALLPRPWITIVVDHYSGAILGYHISFAPPCATSVLAALRHAILPKTEAGHV